MDCHINSQEPCNLFFCSWWSWKRIHCMVPGKSFCCSITCFNPWNINLENLSSFQTVNFYFLKGSWLFSKLNHIAINVMQAKITIFKITWCESHLWLIDYESYLQSYKSLWVPTGELLLDKIFQHNTTHALNNSIGLNFWQEIDSTFPNEHGIKAIWTGVQRFNETHFSERFYHIAKAYLYKN